MRCSRVWRTSAGQKSRRRGRWWGEKHGDSRLLARFLLKGPGRPSPQGEGSGLELPPGGTFPNGKSKASTCHGENT